MQNLINLLLKNRVLLVFLLLQGVCFALIFNSQIFHRSIYTQVSLQTSGRITAAYHTVEEYFNLRNVNENLTRENAALRQLVEKNQYRASGDSVRRDGFQQYRFVPAKVINASYTRRNNYITIDRGTLHGIEPGMGVTGPKGVVGIVNSVSTHFATVTPLLHQTGRVSGAIKNSDYFGPVYWEGADHRFAVMDDIPRQAELQLGDTVVTHPSSAIYPPGEWVGTVEDFDLNPETQFYKVRIRLSTNFAALGYVYVIENILVEEKENLEAPLENEE